jgi:hypothetical protein
MLLTGMSTAVSGVRRRLGCAKAHFVQAELYSRQGKLDFARQALASAEQSAPGLPFAKPEAVNLRYVPLEGLQSLCDIPPTRLSAVVHRVT